MVAFGTYVIRIALCSALVGVVSALLPEGGASKTARALMNAAIAAAALEPLLEFIKSL